jgi:hypothetical protein
MSEVELVVAALAAGASAGLTESASSAVRDGYAGLREAVRRRLASHGRVDSGVLEAGEAGPEEWKARLREVLTSCGVDGDEEVLGAARMMLAVLGLDGGRIGGSVVDLRHGKGVQVGDRNMQINNFN